jgi:tetratricopeptide (TPR) repeat protein
MLSELFRLNRKNLGLLILALIALGLTTKLTMSVAGAASLNLANVYLLKWVPQLTKDKEWSPVPSQLLLIQEATKHSLIAARCVPRLMHLIDTSDRLGRNTLRIRAMMSLLSGNEQSTPILLESLYRETNDPGVLLLLGYWHFHSGNFSLAQQYLSQVSVRKHLSATLERWYWEMAKQYSVTSDKRAVKELYDHGRVLLDLYKLMPVVSLAPGEVNGFGYAGLALSRFSEIHESDLREARQFLIIAQSLEPENSKSTFELGLVDFRLEDIHAAERHFRSALELELTSSDTAEAHYYLGLIELQYKHADEAIEQFQQAIGILPQRFYYYKALSAAYHSIGDLDQAQDAERKAIEVEAQSK